MLCFVQACIARATIRMATIRIHAVASRTHMQDHPSLTGVVAGHVWLSYAECVRSRAFVRLNRQLVTRRGDERRPPTPRGVARRRVPGIDYYHAHRHRFSTPPPPPTDGSLPRTTLIPVSNLVQTPSQTNTVTP